MSIASQAITLWMRTLLRSAGMRHLPRLARDKDKLPYGEGLIVNVPLPEAKSSKWWRTWRRMA